MKTMNLFFWMSVLGTFVSSVAQAAPGGKGVDMTVVMYQAINVGVIVIGLVYFLRQPVKDFFAAQKATYLDAAAKTQAARLAAENELKTIRAELARIESSANESISRARAESADVRKQMISDAEATASRIKADAETSARLEADRAVARLRTELVQEAVAMARQQMSAGVTQEDHQRLNKEFIRNIEAVQP